MEEEKIYFAKDATDHPIVEMHKGEIYLAERRLKNVHYHPIVFLGWINTTTIKACIISSKGAGDNLLMDPSHFKTLDENGNPYKIQYKNSHIVPNITFRKQTYWLNGEVAGCLTQSGIDYIEEFVKTDPMLCLVSIQVYSSNHCKVLL